MKFRRLLVPQAPSKNVQDFQRRFARGANDKDAVETPFIFAITLRQGDLDIIARSTKAPLFFYRPARSLRRAGGRRRFANTRMTVKRLQPVGFRQTLPDLVTGSQQSCFIDDRSSRRHPIRPGLCTATRQNPLCRFIRSQAVPARQRITHVSFRQRSSCSRYSATRLPATAARYRAEDRMSSIGWTSAVAVVLANWTSHESIRFPFTIRSVPVKRRGTGATLPIARRISSTTPSARRPSAARQTLAIA